MISNDHTISFSDQEMISLYDHKRSFFDIIRDIIIGQISK
jgi:hypothetical protein